MQDFLREDIKRPIYSRFILPYKNFHFPADFPIVMTRLSQSYTPHFRWLHSWPCPPFTMMEFPVSSVKVDIRLNSEIVQNFRTVIAVTADIIIMMVSMATRKD